MKKVAWTTLKGLFRDTHATEIAETAVVLPLLFVVLIAILWFGQAFRIYGTITHAAREGARAAVAPACATCTATITPAQSAATAVTNALVAAHLDPSQIQAPVPQPNLYQCGTPGSPCGNPVNCDPSVSNMCVQVNVRLSSCAVTLAGSAPCGTSVSFRYKYPYHFTLPCWPQPCTAMDLGKITLPAQSEMRLERQ